MSNINNFLVASVLLLIALTTSIYFKSLNNEITNWDDNSYISSNEDIKHLNSDSTIHTIVKAFSSYKLGNYHPVTVLSFALEYKFFKLNSKAYHVNNLLLHILNSLLVLTFIWLLSNQKWIALITALFFAIHPMHVESVSWLSERKDLLYSFFYLLGLIVYVKNYKTISIKHHVAILSLFTLSCLSKGMAVSFPLVLLAIDYYYSGKFTRNSFVNKIPYFIVSLVFGLIAVNAQKAGEAISTGQFDVVDRLFLSIYGLATYIWKFAAPINLSCFYSYPNLINGHLPYLYYVIPTLFVGCILLLFKYVKLSREVKFGMLFFAATIVMVLQWMPVGGAIISERYTYIAYIGLFFAIGYIFNQFIQNNDVGKKLAFVLLLVVSSWYSILAHNRTLIWHDTITLWTDVIEQFQHDPHPYNNRAETYFWNKNYSLALSDFNKAVSLGLETSSVFYKRGYTYYELKQYENAIKDFNKAISLSEKIHTLVYFKRAFAYASTQQAELAIKDYEYVISKQPNFAEAYHDKGLVYYNLENHRLAIDNFSKAIELKLDYYDAYLSRGSSFFKLGLMDNAIIDYTKAINIKPSKGSTYYNRCVAHLINKDYALAMKDAQQASLLGYPIAQQIIDDINAGLKN